MLVVVGMDVGACIVCFDSLRLPILGIIRRTELFFLEFWQSAASTFN